MVYLAEELEYCSEKQTEELLSQTNDMSKRLGVFFCSLTRHT